MTNTLSDAISRAPLSQALAGTVSRALAYARHQAHRRVTLEHLLLALTEDADAVLVLTASNIDLRRLAVDVSSFVGRIEDRYPPGAVGEPQADADFMSIIEYATAAARQSNRREINGAIVLAAIVGEGRSPAATMLKSQGLTFEEAIKALQRQPTMPTQPNTPQQPHTQPRAAQPQSADDILAQARGRIPQIRPAGQPAGMPPPQPAPLQPMQPPMASEPPPAPPPQPAPQPPQPPMYAPDPRGLDDGYGRMPPQLPPQPQRAAPPMPDELRAQTPAAEQSRPRMASAPPTLEAYEPYDQGPRTQPPQRPQAPYPGQPGALGQGQPPQQQPYTQPRQPAPGYGYPNPNQGPAADRDDDPRYQMQPPPRERTNPPAQGRPPQAPPGQYAQAGYPPQRQAPPPAPLQQPPPVAGKALSPGQLIENIPRRMRVGVLETVEVRIAREHVQGLNVGLEGRAAPVRHDLVVTRAMSVRLKASDGGFFIEGASPETQWIDSRLGLVSDDFASWRWSVTPQRRGKSRLQLVVAARIVGVDGMAAETVLPEQVFDVVVTTNYAKSAQQFGGWAAAAIAGGLLGKFGGSLWAMALALIGRGG